MLSISKESKSAGNIRLNISMDKGLIGLIILSALVAVSAFLKYVGIASSEVVWGTIQVGLVYHTIYTIYTMIMYKGRVRRRNARRGNARPPRPSSTNW